MEVEAFIDAVEQVQKASELWEHCVAYFADQGIDRLGYRHLPPPGAPDADQLRIATKGIPERWVERYVGEKLYRIDPFALFPRQSVEPFFWRDITRLKEISPEEQRYLAMIERTDLGDGLGIQVFGPNGRNGYCGLGIGPRTGTLTGQRIRTFQLVCELAHLKYCELLLPVLEKTPDLTRREKEVLNWLAQGKSNAAIAQILGVSPHTVDAHLRRLYLKLGVSDRISAALRGLGVGILIAAP